MPNISAEIPIVIYINEQGQIVDAGIKLYEVLTPNNQRFNIDVPVWIKILSGITNALETGRGMDKCLEQSNIILNAREDNPPTSGT